MFSKGEKVAVCYDWKWGRAVEGIVVDVSEINKNGINLWIKVKFLPYGKEEIGFVEMICQPDEENLMYGYVNGKGKSPGIQKLLESAGCGHSVLKLNELKKLGYDVKRYNRRGAVMKPKNQKVYRRRFGQKI